MTNISPKKKQITLLYQIPNGSVPLRKTLFINSKEFSINPYTSEKCKIQFYFPALGEFEHQPSNISEKGLVVAKSQFKKLKVIQTRIIENAKTFVDMMLVANSDDERKSIILDIFKNKIQRLNDPKFKFKASDVVWFCQIDPLFYVKLFEIIRETPLLESPLMRHFGYIKSEVLMEPACAEYREQIIDVIKSYIMTVAHGKLTQFIFRPV